MHDKQFRVNKRPLPAPLVFSCRTSAIRRPIRRQAANAHQASRALNFLHSGRGNDARDATKTAPLLRYLSTAVAAAP
jgi:hypothetical protein